MVFNVKSSVIFDKNSIQASGQVNVLYSSDTCVIIHDLAAPQPLPHHAANYPRPPLNSDIIR